MYCCRCHRRSKRKSVSNRTGKVREDCDTSKLKGLIFIAKKKDYQLCSFGVSFATLKTRTIDFDDEKKSMILLHPTSLSSFHNSSHDFLTLRVPGEVKYS